jgi:hypothetical protein
LEQGQPIGARGQRAQALLSLRRRPRLRRRPCATHVTERKEPD